jgi:hypothetical protein
MHILQVLTKEQIMYVYKFKNICFHCFVDCFCQKILKKSDNLLNIDRHNWLPLRNTQQLDFKLLHRKNITKMVDLFILANVVAKTIIKKQTLCFECSREQYGDLDVIPLPATIGGAALRFKKKGVLMLTKDNMHAKLQYVG